jgi:dTDP-4-dehydrorhamnose reductase
MTYEGREVGKPVKTAVIGASGYVGRHLWEAYRQAYPDVLGTAFSTAHPGLSFFDLREPDIRPLRLEERGHGAALVASAKPNIGFCERHPDEAYAVNVRGTLELVRQLGRTPLQVIFLSSNYVFEGKTGGYGDDAEPRPTTEYGRQKAVVEKEIPSLTDNYLVLRLSWVYGARKGDKTLLDQIASVLAAGGEVRAARDQVFCPTYVGDLVRAVTAIQARGCRGTLNVCGPERWSRYDIALGVARALRVDPGRVKSVSLHQLPGMSGRPLDTSMTCSRLARELGSVFTPLRDCLQRVAANWM